MIDYLLRNAISYYEGNTNLRSRAVWFSLSPSILHKWTVGKTQRERERENIWIQQHILRTRTGRAQPCINSHAANAFLMLKTALIRWATIAKRSRSSFSLTLATDENFRNPHFKRNTVIHSILSCERFHTFMNHQRHHRQVLVQMSWFYCIYKMWHTL